MNDSDVNNAQETTPASGDANPRPERAATSDQQRKEARRWWIKLVMRPVLFLAAGAILIVGLGVAQRLGFISAGNGGGPATASGETNVRYICPMMCTQPQAEPGRCPVCAMELVSATSGGGNSDSRSIQVDPVARRVANIRTVAVQSAPVSRTLRAIGELSYDESTLKTISAYVDGRLDRMYKNSTGVVVTKDDPLALLYSPQLYIGQVEVLTTKRALDNIQSSSPSVVESQRRLYASARQRLIELGMTERQVAQLETDRQANSRLHMLAPIGGTVIERLAVEGQHVKTGQPIYRLADLSTVWLILKLFPEDAAAIRKGQKVEAEMQSLPGQTFAGHVAFIDSNVDPKTRTVGVRVVIPNGDGLLRVGDYAKAKIEVLLNRSDPRFDVTAEAGANDEALAVPRDAVLMAGSNSVLYVETEPGRFELRHVVLGPRCGDQIVILSGVMKGEQVATRGNFLIDSQMQLSGNRSLIDPTKAEAIVESELEPMDLPPIGTPQLVEPQMALSQRDTHQADDRGAKEIAAALAKLAPADRALAERQNFCPVADMPLGSMGSPIKVNVNGRPVFICCEGCREILLAEPAKHLAKLPMEPVR